MADTMRPGGDPGAGQHGFTLVEMMAALAILLVGVTALLATLGSSVRQRRTTDARLEAAALCEHAVHWLQQHGLQRDANVADGFDIAPVQLSGQAAPGFPGMTWSATPVLDAERPDVFLVRLSVQWLEEGETVTEEFLRVLPRQLPLAVRVAAFRDQADDRTR